MGKLHLRRPSAALVISCLALFIALGGAAYAGTQLKKNTVGTKQIKKNAVTTAKLKKKSVTTAKVKPGAITGNLVNEGTLGTVPSATTATTAGSVDSVKTFSAGANVHEFVTLAKTANFELKGWCDPENTQFAPGLESERTGTVMIIANIGAAPAFGDSDDDSNYRMTTGQEIGFNYQDNGDGGLAMSTDGHFLAAPSWGNEVADTSFTESPIGHSYPFTTACHFAGAALVG